MTGRRHRKKQFMCTFSQRRNELMNPIGLLSEVWMWCEIWLVQMGAEYKVHTKLLTEFETLGVMGENCSGIINIFIIPLQFSPITPSVSNSVNNFVCTLYSAPIWTNHISHHIHTSDNNPIGFINSLRLWLKVHINCFFRCLLPVISLKIDINWLGKIQMEVV